VAHSKIQIAHKLPPATHPGGASPHHHGGGFNLFREIKKDLKGEGFAIALGIPPGVFSAVKHVDPKANRWVENAVKCAGRDVEHVAHALQDESGKISDELSKVPIVGGLLHGLYDSTFFVTFGPVLMTEEVVVEGHRINRVILKQLKAQLRDFKEVGPYAQMIVSFIPGVGTAISAAIACGLAVANGQPIVDVLLSGVKGALPGGPLARMAFDVAQSSIETAVEHKPFTWQSIAKEGVDAASAAIALPDIAKQALEGAVTCTSMIISGKRIDCALVSVFSDALPIPAAAKMAIGDVLDMSVSIAQGQKVDNVLLNELQKASKYLPIPVDAQKAITAGVSIGVGVAEHKKLNQILTTNIEHTVIDILKDQGTAAFPGAAKSALNIGLAMGCGTFMQGVTKSQLVGPVANKLMAEGQTLIKSPVIQTAYQAAKAKGAERGFQIGIAIMRHQCNTNQIMTTRQGLSKQDKVGFDMAVSLHVGRVTNPPSPNVSTDASQAGFFMTKGMQGGYPNQKTVIMQALVEDPNLRIGASVGIKAIGHHRASWWHKLLMWLGLVRE